MVSVSISKRNQRIESSEIPKNLLLEVGKVSVGVNEVMSNVLNCLRHEESGTILTFRPFFHPCFHMCNEPSFLETIFIGF